MGAIFSRPNSPHEQMVPLTSTRNASRSLELEVPSRKVRPALSPSSRSLRVHTRCNSVPKLLSRQILQLSSALAAMTSLLLRNHVEGAQSDVNFGGDCAGLIAIGVLGLQNCGRFLRISGSGGGLGSIWDGLVWQLKIRHLAALTFRLRRIERTRFYTFGGGGATAVR